MKSFLTSALIRVLASTWRVHVEGALPKAPCIVVFWHGEMLPIWYAFRGSKPVALVSSSGDGSLLATLLEDWGYRVVRGSSSQGGKEALQDIVANAATSIVLLTPDGPRGPAHVCKPGAVVASHRSGVPVVPVRMMSVGKKIFPRSWDAFQLPLPWSRITVHVGAEIHPDVNATREGIDAAIAHVTDKLERLGAVTC